MYVYYNFTRYSVHTRVNATKILWEHSVYTRNSMCKSSSLEQVFGRILSNNLALSPLRRSDARTSQLPLCVRSFSFFSSHPPPPFPLSLYLSWIRRKKPERGQSNRISCSCPSLDDDAEEEGERFCRVQIRELPRKEILFSILC